MVEPGEAWPATSGTVKMTTRMAGPHMSASPGDELTVSIRNAEDLVDGGFAEWAHGPHPDAEKAAAFERARAETAMEAPPEETATLPEPKPKPKAPRKRVEKPK